ncbi:MAG TPA: enoyl-CoA hydratase-related protein [Candidatus Baltobacteraceae bacterium]|jgi:2-(1,2-epoxy-1,2-dihydrophenyl)acetyl-CoA isomerase|nr:enoyl-CoA hydratase-related protein [Candidatus Baltobacteraceae bacterium]
MSSTLVRRESGGVLGIDLNRPEKLNAFDEEMTAALIDALDDARSDEVRVVVLSGVGRAFCAGQDLDEYVRAWEEGRAIVISEHLSRGYNAIVLRLRRLEKPVIAAINGSAAGAGVSIALACDFRIAADDALFTLGFSRIGLIPDAGASFLLPLLVGFGRGLELAMSSERIDAAQAYRLGLVNRVVPSADLQERCRESAARLAALPRFGLAQTKRAFNHAIMPNLAHYLDEEARLQEEAARDPDHTEGVRAFVEKRAPVFRGIRNEV